MNMIDDPDDFTWQSLYEYIERLIAGILDSLQRISKNTGVSGLAQSNESLEQELDLLRGCLPLVSEMQNKEDLQVVCPIMSVGIIRLRCRHQHDDQVHSPDFAWIVPIADRSYRLKRIGVGGSQEIEMLWSFDGDLIQIVEKVEKLVKEICANETH